MKKTKTKVSQTPPHRPVHTGALGKNVGFPGYSLNKKVNNMKKVAFSLLLVAVVGCENNPDQGLGVNASKQKIVAAVVDYSKTYWSLLALDSLNSRALFQSVSKTGGTLAHIGIQSNSNLPVYITRIDKLDTTNAANQKNIYERARANVYNNGIITEHNMKLDEQISSFVQETRKYEASAYTDLQNSLDLAKHTICEAIYSPDRYDRYVLILSDLLSDPPHKGSRHLIPVDFCGATILLVRPSPALSIDSLDKIFCGAPIHTFSNLPDAITFIDEQ